MTSSLIGGSCRCAVDSLSSISVVILLLQVRPKELGECLERALL